MSESSPSAQPRKPGLRTPYAHILILWLGPLLAWLALWQLLWQGHPGSLWRYGSAMLFGGWWIAMCIKHLGPPDEGVYLGDAGRLWAGPLYPLLAPLPRLSLWLGLPGLVVCWWYGLALGVMALLLLMALLAWLPLGQRRVWIGTTGIWSLGRDIRYIAYDDVRDHGWLDPYHQQWIGEREEGWPVTIHFPDSDASTAFEETFLQSRQGSQQPVSPTASDSEQDLASGTLWPAASRGRWRWLLAFVLMAAWVAWWGWACWGHDVRIARPFSFPSLAALVMGLVVCLQWSRWPPTWLTGRLVGRENCVWRSDDPASKLFRRVVVPCGLFVLGVSGLSLHLQLWKLPALYVSPWTLAGGLLQMALALLILADPTGAIAWRCHSQGREILRRYGWIEQFDANANSRLRHDGEDLGVLSLEKDRE